MPPFHRRGHCGGPPVCHPYPRCSQVRAPPLLLAQHLLGFSHLSHLFCLCLIPYENEFTQHAVAERRGGVTWRDQRERTLNKKQCVAEGVIPQEASSIKASVEALVHGLRHGKRKPAKLVLAYACLQTLGTAPSALSLSLLLMQPSHFP